MGPTDNSFFLQYRVEKKRLFGTEVASVNSPKLQTHIPVQSTVAVKLHDLSAEKYAPLLINTSSTTYVTHTINIYSY